MDIEQQVEAYAHRLHEGQTRKFGGDKDQPYSHTHLRRVAKAVRMHGGSEAQILAAWLHDGKEDQPNRWDQDGLNRIGVTHKTMEIVDALTKQEGENYLDFILRVMQTPDAILVKRMDIQDNLRDLRPGSLRDKYLLADHMLMTVRTMMGY